MFAIKSSDYTPNEKHETDKRNEKMRMEPYEWINKINP